MIRENDSGMTFTINSPALNRSATFTRILGQYGDGEGPTVVVTAGLHGNEPAGVFAIQDVLDQLRREAKPFRGRFIGLAGNLPALVNNVRYIDEDLNRLWRPSHVEHVKQKVSEGKDAGSVEAKEMLELHGVIMDILDGGSGPFYFMDLHTTSSKSRPFAPFDDTLTNREFIKKFPVIRILGIEEFLPGTLLSYLTRFDVVTLGYEAGQHVDPDSIQFHASMLWLTLVNAGCLPKEALPNYDEHYSSLQKSAGGLSGFFDIRYRYAIHPGEEFRMRPGFESFQPVQEQQVLADNKDHPIPAPFAGRIFMPLYQSKGDEGFFLIRPVAPIWLTLSRWLRQWRFERFLAWLPGVKIDANNPSAIFVDTRVARFLATEIFHLLGYRRQVRDGKKICFSRRDH